MFRRTNPDLDPGYDSAGAGGRSGGRSGATARGKAKVKVKVKARGKKRGKTSAKKRGGNSRKGSLSQQMARVQKQLQQLDSRLRAQQARRAWEAHRLAREEEHAVEHEAQREARRQSALRREWPLLSKFNRQRCLAGLPKVVGPFVHQFRDLCREIGVPVGDTVTLDFNAMAPADFKKVFAWMKKKLRELREAKPTDTPAAHDALRAAATKEAEMNRRHNEELSERLEELEQDELNNTTTLTYANHNAVVFDSSEEEEEEGSYGFGHKEGGSRFGHAAYYAAYYNEN